MKQSKQQMLLSELHKASLKNHQGDSFATRTPDFIKKKKSFHKFSY